MTFEQRISQHDNKGMEILTKKFTPFNIDIIRDGYELNDKLKHHLLQFKDSTSQMIRHRGDGVCIVNEKKTRNFIAELKTTDSMQYNFAIELVAHYHHLQYLQGDNNILSVSCFVDIDSGTCSACWTLDIPQPRKIKIPNRFDYNESVNWIREKYPGVEMEILAHKGGSGTPFFLINKKATYLKDIDVFIKEELFKIQSFLKLPEDKSDDDDQTTLF
jgi:hypothetical protein